MHRIRIMIFCILIFSSVAFATPYDTSTTVKVAAPGSMFIQKKPLRFTLKEEVVMPLKWHLLDWQDQELRSGDWPEAGKGELILESLANGYYKLTLESSQAEFKGFRSFAVVPDPASRRHNPNTFFAVDSAQSWLAKAIPENPLHPDNGFEVASEVAYRSGIEVVRERMSWKECEYTPGKYRWNPKKRPYKLNADLLSQRGIAISGMYYVPPKWAKTNTTHLPGDLVSTYNYARALATEFKGQMLDWEFWNEQDIGFAPESAWDYASALKAAYLGFKAGDPNLPVAIGGFAFPRVDHRPYANIIMQNGATEYFDIFNIHIYSPICDYPDDISNVRSFMKRYGIENRPLWVTENGSDAVGAGKAVSAMKGIRAHSPEQEMLLAEILPKCMINLQSLGIDRDFFFVLCPYNERGGNKDWGLMRRDYTVKPALVAYSNLTYELGDAELLGSMNLGSGISGYLYRRPDGTQSLVYWSTSFVDTENNKNKPNRKFQGLLERKFKLSLSLGTYRGVNVFGTPFEVKNSSGQLELTAIRLPSILTGLSGLKPAVPFKKVAKSGTDESKYDRAIVFRVEMSDDFILSLTKDNVSIKKDNAEFKLQVWNLSDQEKRGTLAITGGSVSGLPESVVVAPFNKVEFNLTFTPELNTRYGGNLRIGGTFNDKPVTELIAPIRVISRQVKNARRVDLEGMVDPNNYQHNSSGKSKITYDDQVGGLKVETHFPANSNGMWVYPVYTLQLPQESLKDALGMSFEIKAVSSMPIKYANLMLVVGKEHNPPNGDSFYLPINVPSDKWEERVVIFPENVNPSLVKKIRVGVNPQATPVTFWIRNFKVLFPN